MPGKRDVFQKKYIGKDYVSLGSALILNKDSAWKKISRRSRRAILAARKIEGLQIVPIQGTKEEVDLFRTIWYDQNDPELRDGGLAPGQHAYFAYLGGQLAAGIIVTEVGSNLFLHFNGATAEAKDMQIPSLMIWHIVEEFHNSKFKYLDIGCSFRPSLQEFFKNWATYEYPILYHPPDLAPQIDVTPFSGSNLAILPDPSVNTDEELSKKFNGRPFTYFPRGKHAIFAILKHLGLQGDDEIFITTTTGSPYLSIDVSITVEAVCKWSRYLKDSTKAIFVIHEFGFVHPEILNLQAMCRERKISLIEDCAYAWQSGKAGSYGDYVIYSLPNFFPVQYGGILVGAHFEDRYIWDNFYCLDAGKREIVRKQLSSYIKGADGAVQKRIDNYAYLEMLFANEGHHPFFDLKKGETPAVFMLKTKNEEKMKDIAARMRYFGIECGVFYHNNAVWLPVHQNLSKGHLDYIFGAVRGALREDGWVLHPEYFLKLGEAHKDDRNDHPEIRWQAI